MSENWYVIPNPENPENFGIGYLDEPKKEVRSNEIHEEEESQ